MLIAVFITELAILLKYIIIIILFCFLLVLL